MAKKSEPRHYEAIEYTFDGKAYSGSFYVEDGWVNLSTGYGSRNVRLRLSAPAKFAELLFGEILMAAKKEGRI